MAFVAVRDAVHVCTLNMKSVFCFFVNLYMDDHRALANVGLNQACQINDILQNSCIAKLVYLQVYTFVEYSTLCVYIWCVRVHFWVDNCKKWE